MKITKRQLKRIIKEELSKVLEASRTTPWIMSPEYQIHRFKKSPDLWRDMKMEYYDSSVGGRPENPRAYPGWTEQDFIDVIKAIEGSYDPQHHKPLSAPGAWKRARAASRPYESGPLVGPGYRDLQEGFLSDLGNRYIDWANKNLPVSPDAEARANAKREKAMQFINQHIDDYAFLMYLEEVLGKSRWAEGTS